jgi:hypothetical protein
MGGVGLAIAYFMTLNKEYNIPWKHFTLPTPPKEIVAISHIEFHSYFDDPTGDIVYITTKNGKIYSNTLFQKDWMLIEDIPNFEKDYTSDCAPTWAGAQSDSQIWDPPPTGNNVHDSAGIRFEHSLAIDVRCYVLLDDGNLEVWAREDNAGSAGIFAFIYYAQAFGCLGIIIGIIIGVLVIRFRNKESVRTK